MRIQNNIMAMNTHRFYTANNNAVQKSAEKLSSGYRVNRAGDDAAGLAISEKMRAEIRGLTMASKNSQDGVSMVQTAEGALTEVHSMLQRMKELAVQASSDSNENEIDRPALDQEFQQLVREINDIAETTTFNDMNLLDGSFTGKVLQVGSRTGNEMGISIGNMNAESLGLEKRDDATIYAAAEGATSGGIAEKTTAATITFAITLGTANDAATTYSTHDITATIDGTATTIASFAVAAGMTRDDVGQTIADKSITIDNVTYTGEYDAANGKVTFTSTTEATSKAVTITVDDGENVENGNLLDQPNASAAVDMCREALNKVSTQRAELGAIQNRLEHKISNLDNTVENVSAAEARIRDVDIAKEMTNFTKNQILSQAATAMLAQANSLPQNVLSLLQ